MGRKGGGKKTFLKGVATKPEADDVSPDQGSLEAGAVSAEPSTSDPAAKDPATASPGVPLPDVSSTAEDISSESRGQLTQRHKKARLGASGISGCLLLDNDTANTRTAF